MSELYSANWPSAADSTDPRNQFHETRPPRGARSPRDYRAGRAPTRRPTPSFLDPPPPRVRRRPAATTEACNCPA